mmetsp:Transcript_9333/g.21964  ORF Transcript_9333/g.21964 Transcript_9333/m.21964 type:complete len:481 (-) Transcript_9333:83-1525(-)
MACASEAKGQALPLSCEVEELLPDKELAAQPWVGTTRRPLALALALALALTLAVSTTLWAAVPVNTGTADALQAKFNVPNNAAQVNMTGVPESRLMMNRGEEGSEDDNDCVEGDELLNPDQKAMVKGGNTRKMYQPHAGAIKLWPNGVVLYFWDSQIDHRSRDAILGAMTEWEAKTCIKFQESSPGKGRVKFMSSRSGCNAHVGWSSHWEHHLNLQPPGCATVGVALHELGHTIGLRHEHARPEALEYISFQLGNAQQWWKQWLTTYHDAGDMSAGVPYDMGSIMHYDAWAGALVHGQEHSKTIIVKKPDVFGNCQVGQRQFLSEGDILTVNRWYGCPNHLCADLNQHCKSWEGHGYCKGRYQSYMEANCPHSCGKCECKDDSRYTKECPGWAKAGYCLRGDGGQQHDKDFMIKHCRRSCGNCLMEDVANCKDQPVWNDADGCSKHKHGTHHGQPWCKDSWFADKCPVACDLCPHKPFCW